MKPASVSNANASTPLVAGLTRPQVIGAVVVLTLIYFAGSWISPGFYQHDEAGHYSSMRGFWADPSSVLGSWAKPGYKLLYALPALGGPRVVALVNAAVAALTVLVTVLLGQRLGLRMPLLAGALLALQPLWAGLAWRNYAELPSALLLVTAVWLHVSDRRLAAALVFSYLVTLRQELYPVAGVYGLWLLSRRAWLPALSLAVFPLLINAWGWAATGDPLFLLHQLLDTQSAYRDAWVRQGGEHYFVMALPIFGAMALVGGVAYVALAARRQAPWHWALIVPLVVYAGLHVLFNVESLGFGPSTGGNLRYMTVVAPLVAVLAAVALEALTTAPETERRIVLVVLGALVLLTAVALSYEHNLIKLTDTWSAAPLLTVVLAVGVALWLRGSAQLWAVLAVSLLSLVLTGKRLRLNAEEREVQQVAKWAQRERVEQRPLIATHTLFYYFYGKPAVTVPGWGTRMTDSTLAALPPGALVLWDSHYSYRPKMNVKGQVDYQWFAARPQEYVLLREFVAPDQSFGVLAFEKRAVAPPAAGSSPTK